MTQLSPLSGALTREPGATAFIKWKSLGARIRQILQQGAAVATAGEVNYMSEDPIPHRLGRPGGAQEGTWELREALRSVQRKAEGGLEQVRDIKVGEWLAGS